MSKLWDSLPVDTMVATSIDEFKSESERFVTISKPPYAKTGDI